MKKIKAMQKKLRITRYTISGFIIVMLLIGGVIPLTYSVAGATISIEDCGATPGEVIVIPIMMYDCVDVSTADVNISFDSSVVNVLSVDTSDFDTIIPVINNVTGWLRIGVFQIMSAGLSGDVVLGNVTLLATGYSGDSSLLSFTNVYLEDQNGLEISVTSLNGLFTVEEVIEFFDSFEIHEWNNLWTEDYSNKWTRSTQRATDGTYSAEVTLYAYDATLTLKDPLDLTGATTATLTYDWLIENGWDTGEYIALDIYTGTWQEHTRLRGNVDPEDVWHHETIDLTPYITTNFKIRFRAKVSGYGEDGNIDNVTITSGGG